jgi:hypothetical protein
MQDAGFRRFLFSAWSHCHEHAPLSPRVVKAVRDRGGYIFVDSGMISAMSRGTPEWANQQDLVATVAREAGADMVAHLDIPMERHKLAAVGFTRRHALELTIRNARAFLDENVGGARKMFVLQGWTLPEYMDCLRRYEDAGIPDGGVFGLGTCCMRKATRGLWQILETLREETRGQFLHSFGTGDVGKLDRLARIGIDSVDEGNTVREIWRVRPPAKRLSTILDAYRRFDS